MKRKALTALAVTLLGAFALAGVSQGQPFRSASSTETHDAHRPQSDRSSETQKQKPSYVGDDSGRSSKQNSTVVYVERNRYVVAETAHSQSAENQSSSASQEVDAGPYWPAAKRECCTVETEGHIRTTPIYVERPQSPSKTVNRGNGAKTGAARAPAGNRATQKPAQTKYKLRPAVRTRQIAPLGEKLSQNKPRPVVIPSAPAKASVPAEKVAGQTGGSVSGEISRGCKQGDANSCLLLGRMHQTGNGLVKDQAAALSNYMRACDLGNATACYALGVAYEIGNGTPPSVQKARQFYDRSCKGGNAAACENSKRLPPAPAQKKRNFFLF